MKSKICSFLSILLCLLFVFSHDNLLSMALETEKNDEVMSEETKEFISLCEMSEDDLRNMNEEYSKIIDHLSYSGIDPYKRMHYILYMHNVSKFLDEDKNFDKTAFSKFLKIPESIIDYICFRGYSNVDNMVYNTIDISISLNNYPGYKFREVFRATEILIKTNREIDLVAIDCFGGPIDESVKMSGMNIRAGDINCNGIADITDLTELSLYLLNEREFTDIQIRSADVNGDGAVNMADLAHFKQYICGADVKLGK